MKKLPLHVKIFIALALSFLIGLAANLYLSGNYVFTQKGELLVLEPVEQDKSGNWSLSSDPGDALSLAPQFQGNPLPDLDSLGKEFKVIGSLALASEDGKTTSAVPPPPSSLYPLPRQRIGRGRDGSSFSRQPAPFWASFSSTALKWS